MKEEFILSKVNIFFLFKFPKVGRVICYSALFLFAINFLFKNGINVSNLKYISLGIIPLVLIIEFFLLLFRLFFKNIPYKLFFDLENKSIDFVMSYTDKIIKINFRDIDKILDQITFLKFKCKNGKKYLWGKPCFNESRREQIRLEELIKKSAVKF